MMQKLRITPGGVLPGLVKIESFEPDKGEVSHEPPQIGVSGRTPAILRLAYYKKRENQVANIKSQKKRNKQNEVARERNKTVRSAVRTAVRKTREAVQAGDKTEALAQATAARQELDRAVSKGVLHKNNAANRKSGVDKLVNSLK
jgi:small subunit ribosomal protein S20